MAAPAPTRDLLDARLLRRWRVLFVLYALALTIGTHWPKLRIETEIPSTDKIIHFLAFGGLTWLLWKTRWLSDIWITAFAAAAWTIIDEVSQIYPGLGRTVSGADAMAGLAGVSAVVSFLWYRRPLGGMAEQLRKKCAKCILRRAVRTPELRRGMFLRLITWFSLFTLLASAHVLALMWFDSLFDAGGTTTGSLQSSPPQSHSFFRSLGIIAILLAPSAIMIIMGIATGVVAARRWALLRARDSLIRDRPCFVCKCACASTTIDEHGWSHCPKCASVIHSGQWIAPPILIQGRKWRSPSERRILPVCFALVWLGGIIAGLEIAPNEWQWIFVALMVISAFPWTAFAVRRMREDMARIFARQHLECRECGYDLRGTPTERGVGTCPECGTAFARIIEDEMPASLSAPAQP